MTSNSHPGSLRDFRDFYSFHVSVHSIYHFLLDFKLFTFPGHFQVGDAMAIMPLEVFIKCVGICLRSKTIEKMLADPQKRYTPLRDLPPRLKSKLFNGKLVSNYNGHFSDSLILMAHMGIVQISPGKLPVHRARLNMFVTKAAKLFDTTMSEKGYSHVSLF